MAAWACDVDTTVSLDDMVSHYLHSANKTRQNERWRLREIMRAGLSLGRLSLCSDSLGRKDKGSSAIQRQG